MSKQNEWNQQVIQEFRSNEGKVGGPFKDMDLLLLHTTGAKSGQERVNPVAFLRDDGRYVVVASKGGAPTHPDWYHNLVANPDVKVEVGAREFKARARVAEEPQRSELFARMVAINPGFGEYERKAERTIPVVILTPDS